MSTATQLYRLDEGTYLDAYVEAVFGELKQFLLAKQAGHCQRLDYLPRPVMRKLGQRLHADSDLQAQRIACRVVTDNSRPLEGWEVTGSGAVALREDATYGRVRVFCALFPTGLRLAEEDSLNVATFKTDDAESFDAKKCLERHVWGKVNLLPEPERAILATVLNAEPIRPKPVQAKLRYVLAVLGQKALCSQAVSWETAGAYLYELSLVPDFGLEEDTLPVKLTRNHECVSILCDGEKTLTQNLERLVSEKGLDDEQKRRALAVYLADKDTLRSDEWLPPICHDDDVRNELEFDTWTFSEPLKDVKVELKPLQDPEHPNKIAKGLILKGGALTNDGKKPIQIRWTVTPKGAPDIGGFRIYVIRQTEEGETDVIAPQSATAKRASFMVPMADNNLDADEKCVARIRIQALAKNGVPIQGARDESEEFWIENGEEITAPPPDRGQRLRHLDELIFRTTHRTGKRYDVRSRGWDTKRDNVYSLRLTNNDRGDLVLNPLLMAFERRLLEDAGTLGVFEANVVNRRAAQLEDLKPVALAPAVNQMANEFFQARQAFFAGVRAADEGTGLIETVRLHDISDEALIYVQKYASLVRALLDRIAQTTGAGGVNTVLHDYAQLMRIDTLLLTVGLADAPMQVLLLAPTHPLRVLWLYQYETFVGQWIQQMDGRSPDEIERLIAEDSIDKLVSLNIPNAISWAQGRTFINTDNLDLFWSVLPAADVKDLRTAVNAARQAVAASRQEVVVSTVTAQQVADKIERYLCHHPYVRTLKLNVINPGDGALVLEAIKRLLAKPLYEDMNFDVKFFAPAGTRHQLVGDAFDDFMLQREETDWSYGKTLSETEERLLRPNANPLFPKLVYAKHHIGDLLGDEGDRYEAHLTFVIDFFGTTVATREHDAPTGSSSLHNLLAEYLTDYAAGESTATWSRLVAPSRCSDLASDGATSRLYESHDATAHLAACFYDWGKSQSKYVTVQLELTDAHGKDHLRLLRRVHLISDWVFTIDRNFGIEFYDDPVHGPGTGGFRGYLIDYTPEFLDAVAHRLIISTAHRKEIESILRSGFAELLGEVEPVPVVETPTITRILQVLQSVSGKLALKLINNPRQAQEVIGLALTRLALESDDRLAGRVLLPVDSHVDLFHQTTRELENCELTLKRTDLMLIELQGTTLHIDLIEVKNRQYSSPQAIVELQNAIRDKNENTEGHYRAHFVSSEGTKRFDAEIKNKQLANIIAFYFQRARRYGLFEGKDAGVRPGSQSTVQEFIRGLEAVEAGVCDVSFQHQGFIFNAASLAEIEHKVIHNNDIFVVGRAGIARLLGLVLDEDDQDDHGPGGTGPGVAPVAPTGPIAPATTAPDRPGHFTSPPGAGRASTEPLPARGSDRSTLEPPPAECADSALSIYLGQDTTTGRPVHWNPHTTTPRRLTNQHLLVVGKSGSGKSETIKALIWELDQRSVPSIIFDYQGEYASGDFFDVVRPQVFDVMEGLPINPFELPFDPGSGRKRAPIEMMFRLADTLNTVFSGSGDIQLGILREAIEECYVQQGFDFNDPLTWGHEPPTLEMLATVLENMASDRGAQVRNLQVRLQPLFKGGIFRQVNAGFTFDELFRRTSVIRMTSGIKDLMLAASRFMLEKIYAAMLMEGVTRRLRVMVVIDEAHKLCGDETIISLVKEARKYGLGLVLSSQETRDFHPSVFANTGTLIVLQLEDADATVMSKHLGLPDRNSRAVAKQQILQEPSGVAMVRSQHFLPYVSVRIRSFEDRITDHGPPR